jgi:ribosomal protein L11 methyltransferase
MPTPAPRRTAAVRRARIGQPARLGAFAGRRPAQADTDVGQLLAGAQASGRTRELPDFTQEVVAEQDWVQLTQSQFEPIRVSERLWIVPSWHEAPDPQAIVLVLDPGMAFGTGSHPTTRLCLEWLERLCRQDVGP